MQEVTWIRLLDSGDDERESCGAFSFLGRVGSGQITGVLIMQPDLQLPLKSVKKNFPLTPAETKQDG